MDAVGKVSVLEPLASVADGLEVPVTPVEVADWVVDSDDVLVEVELSLAQLALWGRSFTPAPLQILWANLMVSERGREVSARSSLVSALNGRHHLPFCLSSEHLVLTQQEISVRNDLVEQMHLISIIEQVSGIDPVAHSFCLGVSVTRSVDLTWQKPRHSGVNEGAYRAIRKTIHSLGSSRAQEPDEGERDIVKLHSKGEYLMYLVVGLAESVGLRSNRNTGRSFQGRKHMRGRI